VIRLISVSDRIDLPDFNDIFCTVLGWSGQMGYILRVHGQECNSFRRKTRGQGASVITLKPAIRYHFKTGQRKWPKT